MAISDQICGVRYSRLDQSQWIYVTHGGGAILVSAKLALHES